MDELLKDADVIHHCFNASFKAVKEIARYEKVKLYYDEMEE